MLWLMGDQLEFVAVTISVDERMPPGIVAMRSEPTLNPRGMFLPYKLYGEKKNGH